MELSALLVAIAVLLPMVAGLLCLVLRSKTLGIILVSVTTAVLIVNALLFLPAGLVQLSPETIGGITWGTIIAIADLALGLGFVYLGLRRRSWLVTGLALAQLLPLVWFEFILGAHTEVTPTFVVDWLSLIMVLIVSIVGSIVALYAIPYMKDHEGHQHISPSRQPRFFAIVLLFLGAMNGLVMANNLFWLFFFWEGTTLCSFLLIGHDGTPEATTNAYRALWMNLLGGLGFVAAIILLYVQGQTLSVQTIVSNGPVTGLLLVPLALLCFAGFTKAAQLPFQGWLLGAMVAPTPVSALLHSSTMVKAGVYLVLRLAPAYVGTYLSTGVAVVGAFTFFAAAALAISQTNAKRVLAYSTISNLGLIIACAGINTSLAVAAAIALIVFHAVSKGMLFMAAGVIEHGIWSREIEDMEGLLVKMPLTAIVTIIGVVSMLLPPFGVLVAKWAAVEASAYVPVAMLLFIGGSTLTVVFWTKFIGRILTTVPGSSKIRLEKLNILYSGPLVVLTLAAVALSAFVAPLISRYVIPGLAQNYNVNGLITQAGDLVSYAGSFPIWSVFVALALIIIIPLIFVRVKEHEVKPIYICGEQLDEGVGTMRFRAPAEQSEELKVGGHYFDSIFGEAVLNRWVNSIAIVLIIVGLGVAML